MKCKACGATLKSGSMFCPKCGADVSDQKSAAQISGEKIKQVSSVIAGKAAEMKDAAVDMKADITEKMTELDRLLEDAITEYNDAYTLMNDKGMQLYVERCRATDCLGNVEMLVNSIANHPKSFDTDFEEINVNKKEFTDTCEFAKKEIDAARTAAGGAGAGLAAGATVAFMAPTAAMWVATTFGVASTGTAISTLTGAAATNAALAWLGGGALVKGGAGIAGGQALLALAGPVGWTIAGATLLTSIVLFSKNKMKLNKEKTEEIESVKQNVEVIKEIDGQLLGILAMTRDVRDKLDENWRDCLPLFNRDYSEFQDDEKKKLGSVVNLAKSLSALYEKKVVQDGEEA